MRPKPKIVDITRKFGTAQTLTEAKILCQQVRLFIYIYIYSYERLPCHGGGALSLSKSNVCAKGS